MKILRIILKTTVVFIVVISLFVFSKIGDDSFENIYNLFSNVVFKNMIRNSDFKDNLNYWMCDNDKGITITNIDNKVYAHIKGPQKWQRRMWQDVNLISGKTYRLTFELKGQQKGAFIILKDHKNGKEQYKFCGGNQESSKYSWDILPNRSGKYSLFLSTQSKGDFYYTSIKLCAYNSNTIMVIKIFGLILVIIIVTLLLFFNKVFVFITLFLILLPVLRISKETKSLNENRNLSTYMPLVIKNNGVKSINLNYGINFNEWLNDHFFGRNWVITKNTEIIKLLHRRVENKIAFQADDGWLFMKHDYNDQNYKKTCELIKKNIDSVTDFWSKKGIRIYFAIIPEKECIYSEKHYIRKFDKERIPETLSHFCTNNFIYLKSAISSYKKEGLTYFKEDHHWTHLGAYAGYEAIFESIGSDLNLSVLKKSDFIIDNFIGVYDNQAMVRVLQNNKRNGSVYNILNLTDKTYGFKNEYSTFTPKIKPELVTTGERHSIFRGGYNNCKIMIIGDSNIGYILPFIAPSFSDSLFLYAAGLSNKNKNWNIYSYSDIIQNFKPQIILVLVRAVNAFEWTNLN